MNSIIEKIVGCLNKENVTKVNEFNIFSEYSEEVRRWLLSLEEICGIYSKRIPLTIYNLWKMDLVIVSSFMNRGLPLLICRNLNSLRDKALSEMIRKIRNPKIYVFGAVGFEILFDNEFIEKSKMQYISNYDAMKICEDAEHILRNVSADDYVYDRRKIGKLMCINGKKYDYVRGMTLIREAVIMRNFVKMYSTSRRMLNVSKLLIVVLETSSFCAKRGFVWFENPILCTIGELYASYEDFPFIEKDGETRYSASCSMALPHLTYALIQLWFQYMLLDVTKEELLIAIKCYVDKASTSFDAWVLEFKKYRAKCLKYLTCMIQEGNGIRYGINGPVSIIKHYHPVEIFKDEELEYKEFGSGFFDVAPKALTSYLSDIGVFNLRTKQFTKARVIKDVAEAKRLSLFINLCGQHGLFIKNPVALTLKQSILPRPSLVAGMGKCTFIQDDRGNDENVTPYKYDFRGNEIYKEMMSEGRTLAEQVAPRLDRQDLEQEFIRALTNNSGGVAYLPTKAESEMVDSAMLQALGKKRLIYFILNWESFVNREKWKRDVQNVASSGERKQIERRGRVIQMVSNLAQMGPFCIYLLADILGDTEPELQSKKNSGTIRDAFSMLSLTGTGDYVNESADVEGMDASTCDVHTQLVNQFSIECYERTEHRSYFFCQSRIVETFRMNEDDTAIDEHSRREILLHPGIEMILLTRKHAEVNNFLLNVRELSYKGVQIEAETSGDTFPSGRYSTNAQHGIFNMLLTRVVRKTLLKNELFKPSVETLNRKFVVKISGDDILISIYLHKNDLPLARVFSDHLLSLYRKCGFTLGSDLSRFGCTFLQQSGYFGTIMPKPDRLSIVTSEHGESTRTNIKDGFAEMRDILDELCGRVAFPENTNVILYSMANMLRRIRCDSSRDIGTKERIERLCEEFLRNQADYIECNTTMRRKCKREGLCYRLLVNERYSNIIMPFMYLTCSDGFDLPPLFTCFRNKSFMFGVYTPRGDLHDWSIRQMLIKRDIQKLCSDLMFLEIRKVLGDEVISGNFDTQELIKKNKEVVESVDAAAKKYLKLVYDHELARYLGLKWIKEYVEIDTMGMLKRMRLRKWPRIIKDKMANILKQKLNFNLIVRSKLAEVQLIHSKYNPPESLAYYRSPWERINQAITAGPETVLEYKKLRTIVLDKMSFFTDDYDWMFDDKREWLYQFDVEEAKRSEKFRLRMESVLDIGGGLMVASGKSIERDLVCARMGSGFYEGGSLFSGYYGLKVGPWKEYEHETLVKFAAKVYSINKNDVDLVWRYANINERYQSELMSMITSGNIELKLSWNSILHIRKCFELGMSPRRARPLFDNDRHGDPRIDALLDCIMRDVAYGILDFGVEGMRLKVAPAFYLYHCAHRQKVKAYVSMFSR